MLDGSSSGCEAESSSEERSSSDLDGANMAVAQLDQFECRRIQMQDTPIEPMNAMNVEDFEVLIFESRDLVASVVPRLAPWKLVVENYEIELQ